MVCATNYFVNTNEQESLSPSETARLLEATAKAAHQRTQVSSTYLFALWAVPMCLGYLAWWLSLAHDTFSHTAAWVFQMTLIALGLVLTTVHIVRRTRGLATQNPLAGPVYSLSWPLGFAAYGFLGSEMVEAGAGDEATWLYYSIGSALLFGLIYLLGGALWQTTSFSVIGGIILLAAIVAIPAGPIDCNLVLSVTCGVALGAGAAVSAMRQHRNHV